MARKRFALSLRHAMGRGSGLGPSLRRRPSSADWSATFPAPVAPPAKQDRGALAIGTRMLEGNVYTEDTHAFDVIRFGWHKVSLLSVFDGHGGWQVAKFLQEQLTPILRQKLEQLHDNTTSTISAKVLDAKVLQDALRQAYIDLDELLCKRMQPAVSLGFARFACVGACAITVAVTDSHYVVANTGDCKALLLSGGRAIALNATHNVEDPAECRRVRSLHPLEHDAVVCHRAYEDRDTRVCYTRPGPNRVYKEVGCRIKGILQPSRAFGDFALKYSHMNLCLPSKGPLVKNAASFPYITAEPEITVFPRTSADQMLTLCSDGVTEFLSDRDIFETASAADTPDASADALIRAVRQRAMRAAGLTRRKYSELDKTRRREVHDDATALVFYLSPPKKWLQEWAKLSDSLQELCDDAACRFVDLSDLEFSVSIADPSLDDCPLIAVSTGFHTLTGYAPDEVIGNNCRFLAFDVPEDLYSQETTQRLQAFMKVAISGDPFSVAELTVEPPSWAPDVATSNAACFLRWNRRKDGELFQNLFLMRQFWVGSRAYVLALQTRLPMDDVSVPSRKRLEGMSSLCMSVSRAVLQHMDTIENMLSSTFLHGSN